MGEAKASVSVGSSRVLFLPFFFLFSFFWAGGFVVKYQVYCCGGSKCPDFLSLWTRTLVTVDASVLLIYYFIDPFSNELCGT